MADSGSNAPERQHDFDIQKDVHRKIRNDPDYDDWEYGTEPPVSYTHLRAHET